MNIFGWTSDAEYKQRRNKKAIGDTQDQLLAVLDWVDGATDKININHSHLVRKTDWLKAENERLQAKLVKQEALIERYNDRICELDGRLSQLED